MIKKNAILHILIMQKVFYTDTPWFPLESFQSKRNFRSSKFLLKTALNSWITIINILKVNLPTRVYSYIIN